MPLNAIVKTRVDEELKYEVEEILRQIGLTTSQAITLFLNRIKYEKGIPFDLNIDEKWDYWSDEELDNFGKTTMGLSRNDYDDEDYSKW